MLITLPDFEGGGDAHRLSMMQYHKMLWVLAVRLLVTFKKIVFMKKSRWKTDDKMIKYV